MVQTKGTLFSRTKFILSLVEGLSCTASLCAAMLAAVTLSSCGSSSRQADKKNGDSLLIALPAPASISAPEMARYKAGCENWYDTMLKNRGFNGGIIVAKNGNVVFESYMGTGHLQSTDTITANTPFHIASVSKTFTAMAVLKLMQDGKLNLDDEYVKYFPGFNYPGVTIRSLLNHRSGLPNYVHFMEKLGWNKKQYVTNETVLDDLISKKSQLENIGRPNSRFSYCNSNYALLALLIEKLSGMKYARFMQQTFFKPLQMANTFVFDTSMISTVIPSYDWKGELIPFGFLDAVYGDKNIYSTARDLLTWDKALYSGKIFTGNTLMEAFAPYSNEKPGIRNYGLGWRMNIYPNEKKMIYHNGWWHGNNASFVRLIEDSATIIVMGNKFSRNIYHAKDMAALFGDYGNGMEEEEESITGSAKVVDTGVAKKAAVPLVKGTVKQPPSKTKKEKRK
ncbi:MAG: beta-lactamase family protein [Chitinophagaceae bacterium]|nr:beta-lactamase family protein [Chitinophagaceae bacterium]